MKRRNISNCSQAIAPNVRLVIQSLSPCSGAQDPPIWSIVLNKLSLSLSPRSLARFRLLARREVLSENRLHGSCDPGPRPPFTIRVSKTRSTKLRSRPFETDFQGPAVFYATGARTELVSFNVSFTPPTCTEFPTFSVFK